MEAACSSELAGRMQGRVNIEEADASSLRIAIVVSRYHDTITRALEDGAREAFVTSGGSENRLVVVESPGTYELVALARRLAFGPTVIDGETIDAVVAIGCVITGETAHDRYINEAVSRGLADVSIQTGLPVAFGVLTCQSMEQARARADGSRGNKGREAMDAAIGAACQIRRIDATMSGRVTKAAER